VRSFVDNKACFARVVFVSGPVDPGDLFDDL